MRDIIVEFSGWVQIAPENVTFINTDNPGPDFSTLLELKPCPTP